MITVSIGNLTVTGGNESEFVFALSQLEVVASKAKELGAIGKQVMSVPSAMPSGTKGDAVAQFLSVTGAQRFRRSKEELSAGLTEEQAAQARLDDMGHTSGGDKEAASMEDAEFDETLAQEFES